MHDVRLPFDHGPQRTEGVAQAPSSDPNHLDAGVLLPVLAYQNCDAGLARIPQGPGEPGRVIPHPAAHGRIGSGDQEDLDQGGAGSLEWRMTHHPGGALARFLQREPGERVTAF